MSGLSVELVCGCFLNRWSAYLPKRDAVQHHPIPPATHNVIGMPNPIQPSINAPCELKRRTIFEGSTNGFIIVIDAPQNPLA